VDNSRVAFDVGTAHTEPAHLASPTPFPICCCALVRWLVRRAGAEPTRPTGRV